MTGPGPTPEGPDPSPQVEWDRRSRVEVLADWVAQQQGAFTDAALERAAVASGYTSEEFAGAAKLTAARAALHPLRSTARRWVLAAYGIVWVAFALVYLGRPTAYGAGPLLQLVLTISMGIVLAISLLVIRRGRPDPDRRSRAMALLLAIPVILLVGVAGLCLPFTQGIVL